MTAKPLMPTLPCRSIRRKARPPRETLSGRPCVKLDKWPTT